MTQLPGRAAASILAMGVAIVTDGCIDLSKQAVCPVPAGQTPVKVCSSGFRTTDDGLVDDFEDGDQQVSHVGDRGGYWFTSHDPNGSVIDPSPFKMSDGGAAGSKKVLHVSGQTANDNSGGAWGVLVGANFVEQGVYDASDYSGVSFKAKVSGTSTKNVRFNVADASTHPDGGMCKSCWNHFGKDMTFTGEWQEYVVPFAELQQQPGWGDRFAAVTPSKLIALNWAIGPGRAFDLWIDDVQLVSCK
ncbi:MAG: hypothetical protein FWD17_10270 [Polyangiaceae bacterium]|nr:hypothetical protein [Polyangiaceae bacterium]